MPASAWARRDHWSCPRDGFIILAESSRVGWISLLGELEKLLRLPVTVESDANVAALAEYALGLGKELGVDSLCMLTLGTGSATGSFSTANFGTGPPVWAAKRAT